MRVRKTDAKRESIAKWGGGVGRAEPSARQADIGHQGTKNYLLNLVVTDIIFLMYNNVVLSLRRLIS